MVLMVLTGLFGSAGSTGFTIRYNRDVAPGVANYVQTELAICDDHHGSDRVWAVTMTSRNSDSTVIR